MKAFTGLLAAAAGVAAGGGGGHGGQYSTWVESSPQYEYSTKVWNAPCTTYSTWSKPAETTTYITTSISVVDSTHSIIVSVPCTETLPPEMVTATSVYTKPTTEVYTQTSYVSTTLTSYITVLSISTEVSETTAIQTSVVNVTLPPETVTKSGSIVTLPPVVSSVIIEETQTIVETTVLPPKTYTQSGTTLTLPPVVSSIVVQETDTVVQTTTLPASETRVTELVTVAVPTTVLIPTTITAGPTCTPGASLGANSLGCGGRECVIEFQQEAFVHWSNKSGLPPLRTAFTFVNDEASATCITTICNTKAFDESYRQTFTGCSYPPCPSNTLDAYCNIVVGPIGLPGNRTTSVTQFGPSGWNIILGATPTGRNIGFCDASGGSCVTSTASALSTNLVYTGDVSTVTNDGSSALVLPDLGSYFSVDSPFRACTTAELQSNEMAARLRKRDAQSTDFTWNQQPPLVASPPILREPQAANVPTSTSASTTGQPTEPATPSSTPSPSSNTSATTEQPVSPPSTPTSEPTSQPSEAPTTPSSSTIPITSTTVIGSESHISGTVYVTETVYYSMILSPEQQALLNDLPLLKTGLPSATNPGQYISSVLGLDSATGTTASSTSTFTPQPQSTNVAMAHKEPGYFLTLVLMLAGLL